MNQTQITQQKPARPFHFSRHGNTGFEFDPRAYEVSILDRTGRSIWRKSKDEMPAPIRWLGTDGNGLDVETGDYICKIVYPDDKVAYLPFVFVRRT